ncbi:MAG: serine hydrolase domain-containing protein [Deltaproteobacteria bacterium]|nr:serine hydrolase domain-containing protein [Deltaproteobacteria bacterium]
MSVQRWVRVASSLAEVTEVSPREVSAHHAGLMRSDVERIWAGVEALYKTGTQPAISLCIERRGHVVLERAIGHLRGAGPGEHEAGVPLERVRVDSPFCLFSASKAVTAMLVHMLDDRGLLHIDDRVCEYIPEFAKHGKDKVTIRHVLTHRAGIPTVAGEHNDLDLLTDWPRIISLLCDAKPTMRPGRKLAYHAITGGFILGEIVRRVSGKDVRTLVREEIAEPMGLTWFGYGVARDQLDRVARNAMTGWPVPPGIAQVVTHALGAPFERAVEYSNDERFLTGIVPAGNLVATAHEAQQFFAMMRNDGVHEGKQVFAPRTIRRAVNESSWLEFDFTVVLPVRYGLGMILGADHVSLYGARTPNAFGHLGFINVLCWADPDRDLSVALLTSGKPAVGTHLLRLIELVGTIARTTLT